VTSLVVSLSVLYQILLRQLFLTHLIIPAPNQQRTEDLRQLASHYRYHNGQVGMVSVEASTTSGYKVMIILETPNGF
jgi:hypothetical protein